MMRAASSAAVQEACSQALSSLKGWYEGRWSGAKKEHMVERMEMAHIKLEAALETSGMWTVTSVQLRRWRNKLKRAAKECDDTLRRGKQRLREEEDETLLERIAQASRSSVSSIFTRGGGGELSRSVVRRFEWYAESASEFMKFVELGGTPRRRYTFFDSLLVRHLLAGRGVMHSFVHGCQHLLFFLRPFHIPEYGMEGKLLFLLADGNAPENDSVLELTLRLDESTDVVGVAVRCLQLFTPHHLRSTAEALEAKLAQLPVQDFSWVRFADPGPASSNHITRHWNSIHTILCRWLRPNPVCCRSSESFLPCDAYLEPVTKVYLQAHVPLPSSVVINRRQRPLGIDGEACPTARDRSRQYLKFEVIFSPHAPSIGLSAWPAAGGSAGSEMEMIDGDATESGLYANISFEQMGEIMLPKAVGGLRRNKGATYQMHWRSKHGAAYLRAEKATVVERARPITGTRRHRGGGSRLVPRGNRLEIWRRDIVAFIESLVAHAPVQLQGSILDWIHKEKERALSALKK